MYIRVKNSIINLDKVNRVILEGKRITFDYGMGEATYFDFPFEKEADDFFNSTQQIIRCKLCVK